MKKSQKNVGLVFHLTCYITDHSIKTVFGFFRILGGAYSRGALIQLKSIFWGALIQRGRLFKGGRLIEDLRYMKFSLVSTHM